MDSLSDSLQFIVQRTLGHRNAVITGDDLTAAAQQLSKDGAVDVKAAFRFFSKQFNKFFEQQGYDPHTNGELWLLHQIARTNPHLIVDAGANDGFWSHLASTACPQSFVHAFEPVPQTFAEMSRHLAGRPNIVLNNCGLLDEDGFALLNVFEASHTLSSLHDYRADRSTQVRCLMRTGDGYAAEHGITRINFLKIDVEGAEGKVLAGFRRMIDGGQIDLIQFEYGKVNAVSKWLLADAYQQLGVDYEIGPLSATGVQFKPYELDDEDFFGRNLIACRRDRPDLRALLSNG